MQKPSAKKKDTQSKDNDLDSLESDYDDGIDSDDIMGYIT